MDDDRPHYYRENWLNKQDPDYEPVDYEYEPVDEADELALRKSAKKYGRYLHPHKGHWFHQDMYQNEWSREFDRGEKYFYKMHGPQKWDNEFQEIDFIVNFIVNAPHNPRMNKWRVRNIRHILLEQMVERGHITRARLDKSLPLARSRVNKYAF